MACGIVSSTPRAAERMTGTTMLTFTAPGISIDQAGIDALNKSQPGKSYAHSLASTPEKPLYAASLEVTHQLHCLVSASPAILTRCES